MVVVGICKILTWNFIQGQKNIEYREISWFTGGSQEPNKTMYSDTSFFSCIICHSNEYVAIFSPSPLRLLPTTKGYDFPVSFPDPYFWHTSKASVTSSINIDVITVKEQSVWIVSLCLIRAVGRMENSFGE